MDPARFHSLTRWNAERQAKFEASKSITVAKNVLTQDEGKAGGIAADRAPPAKLVRQAPAAVLAARPTGESGAIKKRSWGMEGLDAKMNPGLVQNRAYLLVTEPLFDQFLDEADLKLPLPQKVQVAMQRVPDDLREIYSDLELMFEPGADIYALRDRFHEKLGAAYSDPRYKSDEGFRQQLQNIGRIIFTGTPLFSYGEDATRQAMRAGGRPDVDYDCPLSQTLEEDRRAIEGSPETLTGGSIWAKGEKLRGHFNFDFMPTHRNNPTHKLCTTTYQGSNGPVTVDLLRFGSPTIERRRGEEVEISPVFLLFLDSLRETGDRLLSFQHQNPDPAAGDKLGLGGKESQRLDAMVQIAKEYSDVMTVVTLPMDGAFFKGKGRFKEPMPARVFVQAFKEIMRKDEHAQLPREHQDAVDRIIDDVHRIFFKSTDHPLTTQERKVFQMITYAYIEKYFMVELKPTYAHSQCKDAMDRAMSLNVISYYLDQIQKGQANSPEVIENVRTMTAMAPLIVKGLGMHGERFELLKQVLDFLGTMVDFLKEQLGRNPPAGIHFQGAHFDRHTNQTVLPPPSAARNQIHYQERMNQEGAHQYFEEGVASMQKARERLEALMQERYAAPHLNVEVSKPFRQGKGDATKETQVYSTSLGYKIEANLQLHDSGQLSISWNVTR